MKGLKRSLRSKPLLNPPLDRGGEIYPCPVKGKGRDRVWVEICFWFGVLCLYFLLYKFNVRDSLIGQINQTLPAKEAGMRSGILWGNKSGMSRDFYGLLQTTGIVHLVVVSGTNVLLVATLVIEKLAYLVTRKRAIVIGMGLTWWYIVIVGMDPPVVRAGLLLGLFYGAQLVGRKFNVGRALVLVFGIMVVADWRMLISLSFWLSFAAFMGVVSFETLTLPFPLKRARVFCQTVWISLWVTPLLALTFGKISLVGPVVNVLVLGIVEIVSLLGLVGMILKPVLWLAYPLLHYIVVLVELVGRFKWASVEVPFNIWMLFGWYVILGYYLCRSHESGNLYKPRFPIRSGMTRQKKGKF